MPEITEIPDRDRVLLITEATYPFHWGGLSTWCHALIRELVEIDFSLIAVCGTPFARAQFERLPNLVDFRPHPLWGVQGAWEVDRRLTGREARRRTRRTTERVIAEGFEPSFASFLGQLLGDPRDDDLLGSSIHTMYRFLREHDFDGTFRSRTAWATMVREANARFPQLAAMHGSSDARISLAEITAASQWIHHWFFPLAGEIPEVDVAHATMGGISSMVAGVAKLEHGSGFLLSEHGIYLRESYLAEHGSSGSLFGKVLKLGFARRMTEWAYGFSDAIAPCCDYNHRWERRIGADQERIRTAYYGVDADLYSPVERPPNEAPIVAWAGRIDPLKDLETLLRAAAVVHAARPEVRFRLYGSAEPRTEWYFERCRVLHAELELADTVTFEGFATSIPEVLAPADLVVLSSISEGFPFSTLEAMLCGKPIVATSVGGIAEQVTPECGRTVRPRDPQALAAAILDVLGDMEACSSLARAARQRAASLFSVERFRATHRAIYAHVMGRPAIEASPEVAAEPVDAVQPLAQRPVLKPAYAQQASG